jgi:hypothetical protein
MVKRFYLKNYTTMKKMFINLAVCFTVFSSLNAHALINNNSISHTVKKLTDLKKEETSLYFGVYKYKKGDPSPFTGNRKAYNEQPDFNFLLLDKNSSNAVFINTKKAKTTFL